MSAISYLSMFLILFGIGEAHPLIRKITEREIPVTTIALPSSLSETVTVKNVTWKLTINVPGVNLNVSHARPEPQHTEDNGQISMRLQNAHTPEESIGTKLSEMSTSGIEGSVEPTSAYFEHGQQSFINSSNLEETTKNSSMEPVVNTDSLPTVSTITLNVDSFTNPEGTIISNLSVIHFFENGQPETSTEQLIEDAHEQNSRKEPAKNSSNEVLLNTLDMQPTVSAITSDAEVVPTPEGTGLSNMSVIHFFEKNETAAEQLIGDAHKRNLGNFSRTLVFGESVTKPTNVRDVWTESHREAAFEIAHSILDNSNFSSQAPSLDAIVDTDKPDIESLTFDGSGFPNEAFAVTSSMLPTKLSMPLIEDVDKTSDMFADVQLQNAVTANVSAQASRPDCPAPGVCLLWFMSQDTCAVDSHCLGTRICCRIRCSKTCMDV